MPSTRVAPKKPVSDPEESPKGNYPTIKREPDLPEMDRGNIGKEEVRHCGTTSAERQISGWLLICLSSFRIERTEVEL
jgi:hypothetical protein